TMLHQDPDSDTISVADSDRNGKYKPRGRFGWDRQYLKYGLMGGLALLALWFFASNGRSHLSEVQRKFTESITSTTKQAPVAPVQPQGEALTSKHCTVPHPGKPLLQYVLMIDAGSTGSRIHVYKFSYCKEHPELESELFDFTKPGLSSYPDDPQAAAESLDGLMGTALRSVPKSLHHCTPVAVKATAGLRLLGDQKSQAILDKVREHLSTKYAFPIVQKDGVVVMDGKDEGVYAWITVNYLLNLVGTTAKVPTAAVFDLGGGSTQIVFEPTAPRANPQPFTMAPGDHHYTLDFNGYHYDLYQHSYLGYGLKEARRQINEQTLDTFLRGNPQVAVKSDMPIVPHPCFPTNYTETWTPTNHPEMAAVTFQGTDTGSWKTCSQLADQILHKHAPCDTSPCSFQGVYQPQLMEHFRTNPIYAFSYFYDRTSPLGLPDKFKMKQLRALTKRACMYQHPENLKLPSTQQVLPTFNPEIQRELMARPYYCMDLNYIYSLLSTGYEIAEDRTLFMAKKLNDVETGWCLGASIALLDDGHYCQVKELD
ncbi:Guanosine-diphosphatase, partial [Dimargaris xerosporica]